MLTRAIRTAVATALTAAAIVWLLLACIARPPSTDAGPDPAISGCCDYFLLPVYFDHPETCLRKRTAAGECRWLTCLGGLVEYEVCKP